MTSSDNPTNRPSFGQMLYRFLPALGSAVTVCAVLFLADWMYTGEPKVRSFSVVAALCLFLVMGLGSLLARVSFTQLFRSYDTTGDRPTYEDAKRKVRGSYLTPRYTDRPAILCLVLGVVVLGANLFVFHSSFAQFAVAEVIVLAVYVYLVVRIFTKFVGRTYNEWTAVYDDVHPPELATA